MASVNNGKTSNGIILNAEDLFVFGIANNTTVNEDSYVFVSSGGTVNDTIVNNYGEVDVLSSGTANGTVINKGGYMLLEEERAKAVGTFVNGGGFAVRSGGTASDTTVNDGGSFYVFEGGNIKGSTIVNQGGKATFEGGVYTGIEVHGGQLILKSKTDSEDPVFCYFDKITIDSAGSMTISAGGSAYSTTVSKGAVTVRKDGILDYATLFSASLDVKNGAIVSRVDLKEGSFMNVAAGGDLKRVYVSAGAVITGVLHNVSEVFRFYGGTLDLNISDAAPDNDALVDDSSFSLINGSYACTLTVNNNQAYGTYQLIEDAYGFDSTITVKDTSGSEIGTLKLNQTKDIGGAYYTLTQAADYSLVVTIGDEQAAVKAPVRGDRDGNGVSDVMFVWTKRWDEETQSYVTGNYAHGYWMNGTNDWWSANTTWVSPEWDNLGSYDMSGDGKADAVMFGNVIVNESRGAYIGYYQDGNDMDGWVTIGFLDNSENVAWQNKVGNLTGEKANSIVWYAPERYALGAWTDGTETWVGISEDFGGEAWNLAGCGDFDGDGKDSVLMSYNASQYYIVDLDGTVTSMGSGAWYNCTVQAIGDFSGDGREDIVLFDKNTGSMYMLHDGNTDHYSAIGQLDPTDWFIAGCGDYNNDGADDLLVRQYTTGMLGYYANGVQENWNAMGYGVGIEWTVIA